MSLENNAEGNWRHFENGLSQSGVLIMPGDLVGFNPQPEPPAVTVGVEAPGFHVDWLPG